jgi:hypothetical protein
MIKRIRPFVISQEGSFALQNIFFNHCCVETYEFCPSEPYTASQNGNANCNHGNSAVKPDSIYWMQNLILP